MGNFIPARLKKAREEMGLTQEAFARALGLSSEFISLLEAGKRAPSLNTLARISAYFNRDASFFLGEKEPAFTVLFRAAAHGLSPEARIELEHFQRYGEDYLRLEEAAGRPLELAPLYSGTLSPERMAAEERRRLGLGGEPIRDIFALLERNGCRILRRPFAEDVEISGVFIFLEAQNAAFALINSAHTACRQVFTAAHEYCHYLKDRYDAPLIDTPDILGEKPLNKGRRGGSGLDIEGRLSRNLPTKTRRRSNIPMEDTPRIGTRGRWDSVKEQFAQEFAARFLMPPAKISEIVDKDFGRGRRLTFENILLIKRYFGVSVQAMLHTLCNLGLLTASQYAEYTEVDPAPREQELFGSTDEEYGPGTGPDSGEIIVSDRYRLMEKEVFHARSCQPCNR